MVPLNTLRRVTGVQSVIPLYHAVSDAVPAHLKYLYPVRDTKAFEKDLDFLCRHYKPVSLEELILLHKEGRLFSKKVFHLTFDDGLREFGEVTAPILKRKGIPATCFLNEGFIDNKHMFFRFKASILIDKLHYSPEGSETWKSYHEWAKQHQAGKNYYRKALLNIDYAQSETLDELAHLLQLDFAEYLKTHKPYLTNQEIKSLIKDGFTFGAHSSDHPKYSDISLDKQVKTTLESIAAINSEFSLNYKVFTFPFTDDQVSLEYFNRTAEKLDLSFGCAGVKFDSVPSNLQRLPVESYKYEIRDSLKKELLYFAFLSVLNKQTIKRG